MRPVRWPTYSSIPLYSNSNSNFSSQREISYLFLPRNLSIQTSFIYSFCAKLSRGCWLDGTSPVSTSSGWFLVKYLLGVRRRTFSVFVANLNVRFAIFLAAIIFGNWSFFFDKLLFQMYATRGMSINIGWRVDNRYLLSTSWKAVVCKTFTSKRCGFTGTCLLPAMKAVWAAYVTLFFFSLPFSDMFIWYSSGSPRSCASKLTRSPSREQLALEIWGRKTRTVFFTRPWLNIHVYYFPNWFVSVKLFFWAGLYYVCLIAS